MSLQPHFNLYAKKDVELFRFRKLPKHFWGFLQRISLILTTQVGSAVVEEKLRQVSAVLKCRDI